MFSQLVQQLSRFLPQGTSGLRAVPDIVLEGPVASAPRWSLPSGAGAIELPSAAGASLFPDTQPAFHDPGEAARHAA